MKALFTCATALIFGLTANSLALADGSKGKSSSGSHSSPSSHGSSSSHSSHGSHSSYDSHSSHGSKTYHDSHHDSHYTTHHAKSYKNPKYHNYHLKHGKVFSQGFYYPGKYHSHWQYCCYNKAFGCYIYCCPWTHCWYYWCAPDFCYYPVYYVPYSCYTWGVVTAYSSAPIPPSGVSLPEPADVIGPTGY